jgi:alkanesulfonate monooxygenase SsuD/methylene tetrahydromethanopterin reductase-like flavin-dependent oxidoreductase (luciferase family)
MPDHMRFALHVPNFGEPNDLVSLGVKAEAGGWDGFFVWDHLLGSPRFPVPIADPWVVLGALAVRTERIRLGTMVTPLARRRPQKLAREAVTVDRLSNGRLVLGVGLGSPPDEYSAFGEESGPRQLARCLDEALEVVDGLWTGKPFDHLGPYFTVKQAQFLPRPVQEPRIPVWVACGAGLRAPLRRAARWDGVVVAAMNGGQEVAPVSAEHIITIRNEVERLRGYIARFDIAVVNQGIPDRERLAAYLEQGVTWVLATGWMDDLNTLASTSPK